MDHAILNGKPITNPLLMILHFNLRILRNALVFGIYPSILLRRRKCTGMPVNKSENAYAVRLCVVLIESHYVVLI